METILFVDDEINYLVVLEALLSAEGYEIVTARDAKMAVSIFREADLDLVITDMKMPGMSGMELLEECKRINPEIPVIMMTAFGSIKMAVEAMKKHAYDFIPKPFENEQLKLTVRKAIEDYRLFKDNRLLEEALSDRFRYGNMVGKSKSMRRLYDHIDKISKSKASVLITGPSGTGKGLIAEAIHYHSARKNGPFISINCGDLSEKVAVSESLELEKGVFTGVAALKKWLVKLANGGTIFLDELEKMSRTLQYKLSQIFQETQLEREGGSRTRKVDVRILSASNRNIEEDVAKGIFREDLFYRLKVIHIEVPSLQERIDDIPLLVNHFIEKFEVGERKEKIKLRPEVWEAFYKYPWSGNVRELENFVERAMVLHSGGVITLDDLPKTLVNTETEFDVERFVPSHIPLPKAMEEVEERLVRRALAQCNKVQSHAAKNLGITKSLIQHKIKKYNITL